MASQHNVLLDVRQQQQQQRKNNTSNEYVVLCFLLSGKVQKVKMRRYVESAGRYFGLGGFVINTKKGDVYGEVWNYYRDHWDHPNDEGNGNTKGTKEDNEQDVTTRSRSISSSGLSKFRTWIRGEWNPKIYSNIKPTPIGTAYPKLARVDRCAITTTTKITTTSTFPFFVPSFCNTDNNITSSSRNDDDVNEEKERHNEYNYGNNSSNSNSNSSNNDDLIVTNVAKLKVDTDGDDEGKGEIGLSTSFGCNRDDNSNAAVLFTMVRDDDSSELIEKLRHKVISHLLLGMELDCRPWPSSL